MGMIVPIAFGEGWATSFALTQIYALAGTMTIASSLDHGFFYGLGRPGRWFMFGLVLDALTIAVTLVTVQYGLVAVAWGFVAAALAGTVARWFLVSHELRTPLTSIGGFAEMLHGGYAGDLAPAAKTYVDAILESVDRLGLLIDDVLDLTSAGEGGRAIERADIELTGVARAAAEGAEAVEKASTGNLKPVWSFANRDWSKPEGQGRSFLDHAVQWKTVWLPYGALPEGTGSVVY